MKMLTATSVAALALGLILSGSAAYAADGPGGAQGNQDTQNQNEQNAGEHNGKKPVKDEARPAPTTNPPVRGDQTNDRSPTDPNLRDAKHRRGNDDTGNDRGRNDLRTINQNNQNDQNDRPSGDRRRNPNSNGNDRNDPNWRDNRRNDPNWHGNGRDDPNWSDNRRNNPNWHGHDRRNVDMRRWHRNFDAPHRFRIGIYNAPRGYNYRRYGYGQRLPRDYYAHNFWLTDFLMFGLLSPPSGYVWVRYGPDALLIDEETGEIIQVQYNVFYS